jgi:hypothetical protein
LLIPVFASSLDDQSGAGLFATARTLLNLSGA